jgi:hypothetical protein
MDESKSTKRGNGFQDKTGKTYGKLTVIELVGHKKTDLLWRCLCECGNTTDVTARNLRSGNTKSCGCWHTQNMLSRSAEYNIWQAMKQRCYNSNQKYYSNYGGRGISVCGRWKNSFQDFLKDIGCKPFPGATIDRTDNEGHYSCGHCEECMDKGWASNVRWTTRKQQANNTRANLLLTFNGETMNHRAWSRKLGLGYRTISYRLAKCWPLHKVLSATRYTHHASTNWGTATHRPHLQVP